MSWGRFFCPWDSPFVYGIALCPWECPFILSIEAKARLEDLGNKMHRISCLHDADNLSCAFYLKTYS